MIDYAKGYSSSFRLVGVDPVSWDSKEEYAKVVRASVERDCTDEYPLLESADVSVTLDGPEFDEGWYRLEMLASQSGQSERVPVCTMLFQNSECQIDRGSTVASALGESVLRPAADRLILTGTYALKGSDGAEVAASLLRECTPAPVVVDGGFELGEHVVFGAGVSYAEAAWTVLKAAGFCIRIMGDGTIHIGEKPVHASLSLDFEGRALLLPGGTRSYDLTQVPNRYFAVSGDDVGVAVNDLPLSRTSVSKRGRYVDVIDSEPVKLGGETMTAYAERKLRELSTVTREFSYRREFAPDLVPFDIVSGSVPELGMEGSFRILKQSLECGKGITVSETAGQEIEEYA